MKRLAIALLLQILFTAGAYAQVVISNAVAKDVGRAYGFYLGQVKTLSKVSKDYPDLIRAVTVAEIEFDAKFGAALINMDTRMTDVAPAEWPNIKKQLDEHPKLNSLIGTTLARPEAVQFIEEVRDRAKGNIPSPVIETLLIFSPAYEKSPAKEFFDGYRQVYEHDGAGKAKGVQFRIEFPRSWVIKEGKRPNIVAMGVSENGHGLEMLNIRVTEFAIDDLGPITPEEISELLQTTEVQDSLPVGSTLIKSGSLTLESLPGYWVRYDTQVGRGRQETAMSGLTYSIFHNDRRIDLTAMVGPSNSDSNNASERFKRFEPLFDQIVNTLVLPSVWKNK